MRILVIGSGGREHALAWAIAKSPRCEKLYVAPGNGGTQTIAENVDLDITDHTAVVGFALQNAVDFVVIGPDAPAVAGLADDVRTAGLLCFGPSMEAARLEGSKSFTKQLCDEARIPTAGYAQFDDEESALAYVLKHGAPIVIKADGLAAGKGVTVAMTLEDAEDAVSDCFSGAFGESGSRVVIEDYMEGEEASIFALCDGSTVKLLPSAQDHKRVWDGDHGPNTGGMGSYSPAPVMTEQLTAQVRDEIILPAVKRMAERGTPFTGVLYAGIMVTADGPKLVEFNVRFGDPECQVLMLRLKSDLLELLEATASGRLADVAEPQFSSDAALTVVMATKGYPVDPRRGSEIRGAEGLDEPGLMVFHAGTLREDGRLIANGGRVLNVTALGRTVAEAQARAYQAVDKIDWPEGFCRHDIGWRAVERERG